MENESRRIKNESTPHQSFETYCHDTSGLDLAFDVFGTINGNFVS